MTELTWDITSDVIWRHLRADVIYTPSPKPPSDIRNMEKPDIIRKLKTRSRSGVIIRVNYPGLKTVVGTRYESRQQRYHKHTHSTQNQNNKRRDIQKTKTIHVKQH